MRIIHLTDAHLSSLAAHPWWSLRGKRRLGYLSWWRKRRHQLQAHALEQVSAAVLALAPDVIAVTGDLVHLGLADEIEVARCWLERLGARARVILVPGNHDCYQADSTPWMAASWSRYLGIAETGSFPSVHSQAGVSFFGLSSACPTPFWSAAGNVGATQLARFETALAVAGDCFRCVLIHHPPVPGSAGARKALRDATALGALLESHGIELVLHGHLHSNRSALLGTRTRVLATAAASSTASSKPASFRCFDISASAEGWDICARLHVLDLEAGGMTVVQDERWQVARR